MKEGRQGDVQTEGIGRQPRDSLSREVVMVECGGAAGGGGCALRGGARGSGHWDGSDEERISRTWYRVVEVVDERHG